MNKAPENTVPPNADRPIVVENGHHARYRCDAELPIRLEILKTDLRS